MLCYPLFDYHWPVLPPPFVTNPGRYFHLSNNPARKKQNLSTKSHIFLRIRYVIVLLILADTDIAVEFTTAIKIGVYAAIRTEV